MTTGPLHEAGQPITILIADDHPLFRKGLKEAITAHPSYRVVGETGNGAQVLPLVKELQPQILLLDLNLPGMGGLEIAQGLCDERCNVGIVVLTMHNEEGVFNKALDLGVLGYVLKESAIQEVVDGIQAAANGEHYISPAISRYLVNRRARAQQVLEDFPGLASLTAAERRILKMIAAQKTSKEIAERLYLSVRTVENHRMNICKKLGVQGSNGLLKFAIVNRAHF